MKTVHKYEIEPERGLCTIAIPADSRVVNAGLIDGKYFVWVELHPELDYNIEVELGLYGTGWDIPEDMIFVSTIFQKTSFQTFVWHVYGRLVK